MNLDGRGHGPAEGTDVRTDPSPSVEVARITQPLVALLFLVVGLSAPLAYGFLAREAERSAAKASASEIAVLLSREAAERNALWRYDTPKLLEHLWVYRRQSSVARIRVLDARGVVVDLSDPLAPDGESASMPRSLMSSLTSSSLTWVHAPIGADGQRAGSVWVASSLASSRRTTLVLLLGFGLLGVLLALALHRFPLGILRRLELRLADSRRALGELNATLEAQVRARSHELNLANEDLRQKEHRLREMSQRALALQESERRAIARDLHDGAGQSLTALRIELELLRQAAADPRVTGHAVRASEISDAVMEDFRSALAQLAPAVLDEAGLEGAIERLLENVREQTGIAANAHFTSRAAADAAPPAQPVQVTCYRVVQEATNNAVRHGKPNAIDVYLERSEGELLLRIVDDGSGFPMNAEGAGGHGLRGMRERVELLGGEISFASQPGQGTTVAARLPLREVGSSEGSA